MFCKHGLTIKGTIYYTNFMGRQVTRPVNICPVCGQTAAEIEVRQQERIFDKEAREAGAPMHYRPLLAFVSLLAEEARRAYTLLMTANDELAALRLRLDGDKISEQEKAALQFTVSGIDRRGTSDGEERVARA